MRPVDVTTIKNVALPVEHGASVMLGESLLVGLLIGASGKGILPALGWLFLFLMSHPFKIAFKDMSRGIFNTRTSVALFCCGSFGILAALFFAMTYFSGGPKFLIALVGAMPFGIVHLWAVVNDRKKEITAELFGALALGASAACIVLAVGYPWLQALCLWVVLAVRAMTSVIYVRERLRLNRGQQHNLGMVIFVHIVGFMILAGLALAHLVQPLILIGGLLLLIRLSFMRQSLSITANQIGLQEAALGISFVIITVFSFF